MEEMTIKYAKEILSFYISSSQIESDGRVHLPIEAAMFIEKFLLTNVPE